MAFLPTLAEFLGANKLHKYEGAFGEEGTSMDDLLALTAADLEGVALEMGMSTIHKRRFVEAVQRLQGRGRTAPAGGGGHRRAVGPKRAVSLVFLGETGVGKSTLLQSFKDFMANKPFEQVRPTPRTPGREAGGSQTQDVTMHSMDNEQWQVNIIDTPGIGDTQGVEKDEEHVDNIVKFLGGLSFNAVCILIKRGEVRQTIRLQYVVNAIRENMPRDVQDNFMVIMTRAEVPTPDAHTQAVIRGLGLPTDNVIPINNIAYEEVVHPETEHERKEQAGRGRQLSLMEQAARHTARRTRQFAYENNHAFFTMLLETAHTRSPYHGGKMLALKQKRDALKERVGLLTILIHGSFETERQVKEQMLLLDSSNRDMENYKNFQRTTTVRKTRGEKTQAIVTHCNPCRKACHIDCGLSYDDSLALCACIHNSYCTGCGCHHLSHTHLGWNEVTYEETTTKPDPEMRRKWEDARYRSQQLAEAKRRLEQELRKSERERDQSVQEIMELYRELESLALVGHNESLKRYLTECRKAVLKTPMTPEVRQQKLAMYDSMLAKCSVLALAVSKASDIVSKGGAWTSQQLAELKQAFQRS